MALTIILIIVGLFVGDYLHWLGRDGMGTILGGFIGYLVAQVIHLKNRLDTLEEESQRQAPVLPPRPSETETSIVPPEPEPSPPITSAPAAAETVLEQEPSLESLESLEMPEAITQDPTAAVVTEKTTDLYSKLMQWLFGGNTVVRVGIIVLFVGVAFLIKYAADHNKFPIELRLMGAVAGAIVMLVIGWRLREKREGYALAMQGGAVGILYLTVFAAMRMYHLIPPGAAFALLFGIAVFSAALAVLQNSMSLAIFGIAGGFLAPILTSTGQGNHVVLFSYYALLNIGILGISWYKAWRPLNILGFVFTFGIATAWGVTKYVPSQFGSTEPFLIFFFLLYVFVAVLFALRQTPKLLGYVDGTLVFGTPLVAFTLQYELVSPFEFGLAWSALALGLFYLVLGFALLRLNRSSMRAMIESFLAIGIVFGSLAVPLALDGQWTSAIWALEGTGILWIGVRQARLFNRLFALLLHMGAAYNFIATAHPSGALAPILNSFYIGCFILSISALINASLLHKYRQQIRSWEGGIAVFYLIVGIVWWYLGGFIEIHHHVNAPYEFQSALVFTALSCLLAYGVARWLNWSALYWALTVLLPVAVLVAVILVTKIQQPLENGGYIAWPVVFMVFYWLMAKMQHVDITFSEKKTFLAGYHTGGMWLLVLLLVWQVQWLADQYLGGTRIWYQVTWVLIPGIYLLLVSSNSIRQRWPVSAWPDSYVYAGAYPMVFVLWLWSVAINFMGNGNPAPLPYIPLLNPLDISVLFSLMVIVLWSLKIKLFKNSLIDPENKVFLLAAMGGALFIWLNAVLLRSLHFWMNLQLNAMAIKHSIMAQAALSIFWGVLALVIMVLSSKKKKRIPWIVGAVLLGVTVIKLFTVDLQSSSNLESIFSFIGVGVLALIIGYLSPIPPKSKKQESPA